MKVVCLIENTSKNDQIASEHGLSLYIEINQHKILFDMGQSDLFLQNAQKLGVELKNVDIAVLSHGHYDHGGGLGAFLDTNTKAKIYVSSRSFEPHYNGEKKYIGLDDELMKNNRLLFTYDDVNIDKGITLHHCNNEKRAFDLGSFGLNTVKNGQMVPDDFHHEQYLLLEENGRRILISGCSHKGILNIVQWFTPDVVVGGFHFSKLPLDDTLVDYAQYLNKFPVDYYTCHCTGEKQYDFMKKYMNKLFYLSAGESINI